ncbi:MAG: protein tyrosine phosphatase [Rhodothermaceae bacterium]|nr:protein tyrosine phosphatase [Rhodothermaceae bacterium]
MLRWTLYLLLAATIGCAEAQPESAAPRPVDSIRTVLHTVLLGDSTVTLAVHEKPGGVLNALVLHDDENTAVEAGLAFIEADGGRLVDLQAQGNRNVAFALDGQAYRFDPNRMFSRVGIRRTLEAQSTYTPAAAAAVRAFADSVLAVFAPEGVVVTLHNNTPDRYSALSYTPDGEYADDAAAVFLQPEGDPDDFFFATDLALYTALAEDGFNTVLQNNASVTDDGSLSVLAAAYGWPYVNVEAEHGHHDHQRAMLAALVRLLATD